MEFECPECKSNRLEEVMTGVTQYTEVTEVVDEEGDAVIDYGDNNMEGGEVVKFQCLKCGLHIADNQDDLLEFLQVTNML
jgi:hypothetical protein